MENKINLILISGRARNGKGLVSSIIKEELEKRGNKVCEIQVMRTLKGYLKDYFGWDGSEETKPRELLQQLGIELIKNKIDNRLFINRILEDIEIFSYFYDIIVISDVRLVDEIESLKQNHPNSISIRVNRNNYDNKLTDSQKNHLTEIGLDEYSNFDYMVENDDNLELKVIEILSEV